MMPSIGATPNIGRTEFIVLLAALMSLNALAIDIMLPALPDMGDTLGVGHENDRQFVIGAYLAGFGVAQLLFGPLSDRFGRRMPLLAGLAVYVVCAFAATLAPDFGTLLALRFVQGLGAAGTRVISTSVVRDRFEGREMAEVMSLIFMVFMAVPILAPGLGQVLLTVGPWETIFVFMGGLALAVSVWAYVRLPETLRPEYRRALTVNAVTEGFRIVVSNRVAFFYGLAGMFLFAGLFGFIAASQQIFVDHFGLGELFPLAFAGMAGAMAVGQFANSRIVRHVGMRRLSHGAMIVYLAAAAAMLFLALWGALSFPVFFVLLVLIQFFFGWAASNMNALSMEPLGPVAGTAASVFGFVQTIGGTAIGTVTGQMFDGTLVPIAGGFVTMALLVFGCILIAEKGRLFTAGAPHAAL